MNSKVETLFDYRSVSVPSELGKWHMPQEELEAQLNILSHAHAIETEEEMVEAGDSVACRGESDCPRWNREVLLFYPGHGLCDETLENGLLGARVGETRSLQTPEGEVRLTVQRIVRRKDMPISDAMVQCEGIEGVTTLTDYSRWFREQKEDFYRQRARYQCAKYILDEVEKNSLLSIDPEEQDAWVRQYANCVYDAMVAAGMDPTVPEEGVEFLTEEQARKKMFHQYAWVFPSYLVQSHMAELLSGKSIEDICKEGLEKLAAAHGMTVEAVKATSCQSMIYGKFALEAAMDLLGSYAERFLEE